jgi:DNA-binding GntR family transcriptional regulator
MDVVDEHSRIVDAYERVDLAGLSETIRIHIMRQRRRILAFFKDTVAAGQLPSGRSSLAGAE